VASLGEIRQQLAALVVRMRGDRQHRAQFVQLQQRLLNLARRSGLRFQTRDPRQQQNRNQEPGKKLVRGEHRVSLFYDARSSWGGPSGLPPGLTTTPQIGRASCRE